MATLTESWGEQTSGRRTSLLFLAGLIILATIGSFFWLTAKDYAVLFTDMEPRDAARVVTELERQKISYKLGAGGTDIMVPSSEVHEVRLKMMGANVPLSGGVGFEIFDESDFGMTDFAQQINYQRALEGELTRTIMSLEEVKYARVHLVMPEKGLFRQKDSTPTASVTLFLKSGFSQDSLDESQVSGIQRLVASAVPHLRAPQVTVSDQAGITLSRQMPSQTGMAAVSHRLQQKQAVESYLTGKVEDVLGRTFGVDQVTVSVDVTLNFDEVKRTEENVITPDDGAGSILRRRETRLASGADTGTGGNVTTEVEYKLGRTIKQIVETPGEIKKLSVGVMVPADISTERIAEISKIVEMAVGIDPARGDAVAVYVADKFIEPELPSQPSLVLDEAVASSSATSNSTDRLSEVIDRLPMITRALALAVAVLLVFLVLSLFKSSTPATLSAAERDETLEKLKRWLDQPIESRER